MERKKNVRLRTASDLIQQVSSSPTLRRATVFTHQLMAQRSGVAHSHVSTVPFSPTSSRGRWGNVRRSHWH